MRAFFDNVKQAFDWVSLPKFEITDVLEILIIAFLIYHLINWVQRTRAWYLVKGLVMLLLVWIVATIFEFTAILWIFRNAISVGIIAIFIIFQPELRRALEQLGRIGFDLFLDGQESIERAHAAQDASHRTRPYAKLLQSLREVVQLLERDLAKVDALVRKVVQELLQVLEIGIEGVRGVRPLQPQVLEVAAQDGVAYSVGIRQFVVHFSSFKEKKPNL